MGVDGHLAVLWIKSSPVDLRQFDFVMCYTDLDADMVPNLPAISHPLTTQAPHPRGEGSNQAASLDPGN